MSSKKLTLRLVGVGARRGRRSPPRARCFLGENETPGIGLGLFLGRTLPILNGTGLGGAFWGLSIRR